MKPGKRIISAALSLMLMGNIVFQPTLAEQTQPVTSDTPAQSEEQIKNGNPDAQQELPEPQDQIEQSELPEQQDQTEQNELPEQSEQLELNAASPVQINLAADNNVYTVATADQLSQALASIEAGSSAEATIMLAADIDSSVPFAGIDGKSITVKSLDGNKFKLNVTDLAGDCTFDNVSIVAYQIYANGHKAVFTENVDMRLSRLFGGSNTHDVENTYVVVHGGHIGTSDFSLVGGGDGYTVTHDVYLEVGGNAIIEKLMTGANTSSTNKPIGGNVTIVYDRPTDPHEVEAGLFGDIVNISGTYCNPIMGDLNITVKAGYIKGIEAQRGDAPASDIKGNIHVVVGDPAYEYTDNLVRLVHNWGIYGSGSQMENNYKEYNHQVGGNVTIDTYENLWGWGGASNTQTSDVPPTIHGGLFSDIAGDLTINAHGSHVGSITGVRVGSANNITINTKDIDLDNKAGTSYIYPKIGDDDRARGNVTIRMDGGSVAQINCSSGITDGKTLVYLSGEPHFIEPYGVWGENLDDARPQDQSVLICDHVNTSIPIIGYFSQVFIQNQSQLVLGTEKTKSFAAGSIYDVTINDSSLITENQAWSKGNVTMDNSRWTANGYVYVDNLTDTHDSTLCFNNYTALGYGKRNNEDFNEPVVRSDHDVYSFNKNRYIDKIYGTAVISSSTWNVLSPSVIYGDYQSSESRMSLPVYAENENYPDTYIPLEILGKASGKTDVRVVEPDHPDTEGMPVEGQNYISALNSSEDSFTLANANAAAAGLFFKRTADADQQDKADYDMWQVAKIEKYPVVYQFISATEGHELPAEVITLLPEDNNQYPLGSVINALQPEHSEVRTTDGLWVFKGYDSTSKEAVESNADAHHRICFTGSWLFKQNSAVINEAPVITAENRTLNVKDPFDPMSNVRASDKEDGDLTSSIEVIRNTVDMDKAGVYDVIYRVKDSQGAQTTKAVKITVKEKATVPDPDVNQDFGSHQDPADHNPDTSDTSHPVLWISLAVLSGVAAMILFSRKRKED